MSFVTLWIVVRMERSAMIKKIFEKIVFEIRMHIMDARWHSQGFHCFELYPPSFYYRYTPEEQKQIRDRNMAEIRALIEEFED